LKIGTPSAPIAIAPRWKFPPEIGIGFAAGVGTSGRRHTFGLPNASDP